MIHKDKGLVMDQVIDVVARLHNWKENKDVKINKMNEFLDLLR